MPSKRTRAAKVPARRGVPLSPSRAVAIPVRVSHANDPTNPREMDSADRLRLPHRLKHYYDELDHYPQYVKKYRTYGYQTRTVLKNFSEEVDPCIIMERIFQKMVDRAVGNARRNGHEPYWIGVAFRAEGQPDEWLVEWKTQDENRAGRLIGEFEKFHQSARRLKLEGKPVDIRVTIVADVRGARYRGKKFPTMPPGFEPKGVIVVPPREDNLCLAVSIVVAMQNTKMYQNGDRTRKDTNALKRLLKNPKRQVKLAKELLSGAGIPDDQLDYGYDDIQRIQEHLNEQSGANTYSIVVFTAGAGDKPVYKGPTNAEHILTLFHQDGHYQPAKSPAKLFGRENYCMCCEVTYKQLRDHSYTCLNRCRDCLGSKDGVDDVCEPVQGVKILCNECGVTFHNYDCYNRHKKVACNTFAKCDKCQGKYRKRERHTCGEHYCHICKSSKQGRHECHIQKYKAPEFANYRIVTYDCETEQRKRRQTNPLAPKRLEHNVNTLCARVTCVDCIKNGRWKNKHATTCKTCGPVKHKVWTKWDDGDPVEKFVEWVANELPKGHPTYAYAHNGGRFDVHFILQQLYKRGGVAPKMQAIGSKIFQLHLKKSKTNCGDVYFRDSCMILPMALDKVPKALGFDGDAEKQFFPHLYNRRENYHVQLDRLPALKYYIPKAMAPEKRRKLKLWYNEQLKSETSFELCQSLVDYCTSDVDILMEAMVRVYKLVKELAKDVDLLPTFTTTAGLCRRLYQLMHYNVDDKTPLAAFPETGYYKHDRQSAIAMKWLKWFGHVHNVKVQHRDTSDGEKHIRNYKVDGFIQAAERNSPNFTFCDDLFCRYCRDPDSKLHDTVLEFQGCAYHGCNECFPNAVRCPNGKKSDENYERTERKINNLADDHQVIEMWECTMKKMLKEDKHKEMKDFFDECIDTGPMDPREAFYGGRTGPSQLRYKKKRGYKIKYFDVCSLYPHVMRKEYPIGHPSATYHLGDTGFESDVNWVQAADNPYRGVVKVRILPPKHLAHPVLPVKHANRLVFPCCRKCMEQSVNTTPYRKPGCTHTEEERSWVGTYFTEELNVALARGYRVDKIIEAWHWNDDKWTDKHFRGYVETFVSMKTEASGWKKEILDATDPEKAKDEFIEAYRQKGIHLRKDRIEHNEGLKTFAKLCANSLWGRFGMRPNTTQAEVVSRPSRLYELIDGPQYDVKDISTMSEELLRVSYKYEEEFHPADPFGNVVVALITAAYGRMELYKYMEMVDVRCAGPKGSRCLYTDTDSVVFKYKVDKGKPNNGCPIKAGKLLGDMEDEYPDEEIQEYVSAGNKQYALFLRHKRTGKRTNTLKIRGITLDYRTSKKLDAKVFRDMIAQHKDAAPIVLRYDRIMKDKWSRIHTTRIFKKYVPYFKKAWIDNDKDKTIWPYGYVPLDDKIEDMLISAPSTPISGYTPAASPHFFNPVTPSSFSPPSSPDPCLPPPPKKRYIPPPGVDVLAYSLCPKYFDDLDMMDWSPPSSPCASPSSPGPSTSSF